jgi:hypothetical protein
MFVLSERLEEVYQKDPSIVSRNVAGEIILVPIRQKVGDLGNIFTLNETAARIWELIDGEITLGQICGYLLDEFEVDALKAQNDLFELVGKLESIGALVKVNSNGMLPSS